MICKKAFSAASVHGLPSAFQVISISLHCTYENNWQFCDFITEGNLVTYANGMLSAEDLNKGIALLKD